MIPALISTDRFLGKQTDQFGESLNRQVRSGSIQGYVGMHSMAELYSVLSKLPLTEKIQPALAQTLIVTNLESWVKVSLDFDDYCAAIDRVTQSRMVSGAIFDALIAQAALKAEVDRILTFNVKDFSRLGDEVSQLVQVPE